MCKRKSKIEDKNKISALPREEFYPETGRRLLRPCVNIKRAILLVLLHIATAGAASLLLCSAIMCFRLSENEGMGFGGIFILVFSVLLVLLTVFRLKRIVIFVIRLYQRYGPYDLRSRCLFVPNCSEYMILAIEKYGLIRGIKKGKARFDRCHAPNGGEDYP